MKFVVRVLFVIALLVLLCSCDYRDEENLSNNLGLDFQAECSFEMSDADRTLSGGMLMSNSGQRKISFLSPDELNGMEIASDASGSPDIITFEYSGIKVPLDSGSFTKINLIFSMLSPEALYTLSKSKKLPEENAIQFTLGEYEYRYEYDEECMPVRITAANQDSRVSISFDKIKMSLG